MAFGEELCRFCAVKRTDYYSIFKENLQEALETCLGITVQESDNWPKFICKECLEAAKVSLDFISTIRRAEATLRGLFGELGESILMKPEIEIMDVANTPQESEAEDQDAHEVEKERRRPRKSPLKPKADVMDFPALEEPEADENKMEIPKVEYQKKRRGGRSKKSPMRAEIEVVVVKEMPSEIKSEDNLMDQDPPEVQKPLENGHRRVKKTPPKTERHSPVHTRSRGSITVPQEEVSEEDISSDDRWHRKSPVESDFEAPEIEYMKRDSIPSRHSRRLAKESPDEVSEEEDPLRPPASTPVVDFTEQDKQIKEFFGIACRTCSEAFDTLQAAKNHSKWQHQEKFSILCCDKVLISRTRIMDHLNGHVNPDAFKCDECQRTFLNHGRLQVHIRNIHTPKEDHLYQCPECPRTFMQFSQWESHQMRHMSKEEKHFRCHKCRKAFGSKTSLKSHIRNVHEGGVKFVCDVCAKVIKGRYQYNIHVNSHKAGPGDFPCPICKKLFRQKRSLKDHVERHNEKGKIFQCDLCGHISPSSYSMKCHMRIVHLLSRSHKCQCCDAAFKTKVALKEHVATHTNQLLYSCLFCKKKFNSSANKYAHQKRKHPEDYEKMKQKKYEETHAMC